jgi:hypothetical protein
MFLINHNRAAKIILLIFSLGIGSCKTGDREHNRGSNSRSHQVDKPFKVIITIPVKCSDSETVFAVADTSEIARFRTLVKSKKQWGFLNYRSNFSIHFYNKEGDQIESWETDYGFKDSIWIIGPGDKCLISRKEWEDFFHKATLVKSAYYSLMDLDVSRNIRNYCRSNHIPFAQENKQEPWLEFEGEFSFTTKRVGKAISKDEILKNIQHRYPKEKYQTDISGWYEDSLDDKDTSKLYWQTVTVKCDDEFFKKFDLYYPKTGFKYYYPEFTVYGSANELKPIREMADKARWPW